MLGYLLLMAAVVVTGGARRDYLVTDMVGLCRLTATSPMALWIALEDLLALLLVVPPVTAVGGLLCITVFVSNGHLLFQSFIPSRAYR